jgi:hypothetical protein
MTLITEKLIGLNFMDCLSENLSLYFDAIYLCGSFQKFLLLNFFFRLNFYALKRLDFLNKQMKQQLIFSKLKGLFHVLARVILPASLLLYIFFTLAEGVRNIFKLALLNLLIGFFIWITLVRLQTKNDDEYHMKTALIFKAFCMYHIVVTIADYAVNIFMFFM